MGLSARKARPTPTFAESSCATTCAVAITATLKIARIVRTDASSLRRTRLLEHSRLHLEPPPHHRPDFARALGGVRLGRLEERLVLRPPGGGHMGAKVG